MADPLIRRAIAFCLVAALCFGSATAWAVDAGAGTKNFLSPGGVPNYFSNEAEPFLGESAARGPMLRSSVSHMAQAHGGYARPDRRGREDRYVSRRGHYARGRGARLAVYHGGRGPHHLASHRSDRVAAGASRSHLSHASHSHAALRHVAARRRG